MEKALVVSILENTYINAHKKDDDEKNLNLFPKNWAELDLDDKMIMLDKAISSGETIQVEYDEIEEKENSEGMKF